MNLRNKKVVLKKMFFIYVMIILLLNNLFAPIEIYAEEKYEDKLLQEIKKISWIDKDGNVNFPINIDDERWKYLYSDHNKFEVCQIPDDILMGLSTLELLKLIEIYPQRVVLYNYDDIQEGFEYIKENFNGINELLNREDVVEILIEEYINTEIVKEFRFDYKDYYGEELVEEGINKLSKDVEAMKIVSQDAADSYKVKILEVLLAQKEIQQRLSLESREILDSEVLNKIKEKQHADCFEHKMSSEYCGVLNDAKLLLQAQIDVYQSMSNVMQYNLNTYQTRLSSVPKLYTRGGLTISYTIQTSQSMTDAEAALIISSHVFWKIIDQVKYGYNCFAYAYLFLDNKNRIYRKAVWVTDSSVFQADETYQVTYGTPKSGSVYEFAGHAAIVVEINHYFKNGGFVKQCPLVESKMGGGPLVSHPFDEGFAVAISVKTTTFYK